MLYGNRQRDRAPLCAPPYFSGAASTPRVAGDRTCAREDVPTTHGQLGFLFVSTSRAAIDTVARGPCDDVPLKFSLTLLIDAYLILHCMCHDVLMAQHDSLLASFETTHGHYGATYF